MYIILTLLLKVKTYKIGIFDNIIELNSVKESLFINEKYTRNICVILILILNINVTS